MNKLEPNMYVRTKWGIAKYLHNLVTKATIYRVIDKKIVYDNVEDWEDYLLDNEIIKASNNIIDLIEEGDYVNGHLVENIKKVPNEEIDRVIVTTTAEGWDGETLEIYKEEIKTIVTKEQFSSMEYRLGE